MRFFRTRRFFPLFVTQFLGAFNDNLLKNALVMLVTYRIASQAGLSPQVLVALAGGIFILPFFLFSAVAGQLADKFDRAWLTRIIKLCEIGIMVFAAIGFFKSSTALLLTALFGMGVHSTFFGPIKYALLPQNLNDDELLPGNAMIEAGTFLAILLGTILGGLLVLAPHGVGVASAALLCVAGAGYFSSRYIPATLPADPALRVNLNIFAETAEVLQYSRGETSVFLCILGISWFWLVGSTLLAEFAPFVKNVLHAAPEVVTLFLTMFSIGVGAGSFLCNLVLRGRIRAGIVPLAALGISLFGVDLYFASRHFATPVSGMFTLAQFITRPGGVRILADLFLMSLCGGAYILPLYAIMQHESAPAHRARVIAANNIVNSLFMVVSALATIALLAARFTIPQIFLCTALANFLVAVYIFGLRPAGLAGRRKESSFSEEKEAKRLL